MEAHPGYLANSTTDSANGESLLQEQRSKEKKVLLSRGDINRSERQLNTIYF